MWSGPRNLSTAMMRSFENRADCAVWDEPFYAAYLQASGADHPMRAESIAEGIVDPTEVAAACLRPAPGGATLFYQKHMTHHMLPDFDLGWIPRVRNAFLIRAPERVVASYAAKREQAELHDLGFVEQKAIFDRVAGDLGRAPPVIDAADVRADPERTLTALCAALEIPFDPAMLRWPAGRRATDGVWAAHWYGSVEKSTGFAPSETDPPALADAAQRLADQARPYYEALRPYKL